MLDRKALRKSYSRTKKPLQKNCKGFFVLAIATYGHTPNDS